MQIDGKTQLYGIVGRPVSHSLSPAMQNAAFQHCGLNKVYLAFEVEDITRAVDGLRSLGVCGVSVTMPHKQTVIPLLDGIDPIAEKIGAVNTLHIKDGKVLGYNTDWIGAVRSLEMITDLPSARVLVLGAGGSARAVGFGLREKGAEVLVANRTLSKGQALASELDCECFPLAEIQHLKVDALVNTTAVGMEPNPDATLVPRAVLENIPAVMDIVYVPLKTRLLREASEAGCKTVNGIYMLLYQGVAQFELWAGCTAPVDVMREVLFSRFGSSS